MKRLTLLALALFLWALFPLVSHAQSSLDGLIDEDDSPTAEDSVPPQRIGVPSSQFNLSSNESGSVSGFCFDEYQIAPRRVTRFENVLAGDNDAVVRLADGSSMTLQQAIDRNIIDVRAVQLRLTFTNRDDQPVAISLKHPAVFWDRKGGDVNPMALAVLESGTQDYDWRQKMVWRYTTSERMLATLGYYDGSYWNIDRDRFEEATRRYQQEKGLLPSGELDQATMAHIAGDVSTLEERLVKLGFLDFERRSLHNDPAAQIRSYQAYLGQPRDGHWSPNLDRSLGGNEDILKQIVALRSDPRPVDEALKGNDLYPNVVTYVNGPSGFLALVKAPNGVELWRQRGRSYFFEGRNEKAATKLDDAAAQLASRATKGENVVLYPRAVRDKKGTVMIGNRAMPVDALELNNFVDGGDVPASLASAVAPFSGGTQPTGGTVGKHVVLYRGPLSQGRLADPKAGAELRSQLGIEPVDGGKLASALDRVYGDKMALFVSDDLRSGATRVNAPMGQGKL